MGLALAASIAATGSYTPDMVAETWREMEKLVAAGKVKAIGVSNFTISKLEQLFKSAKIRPAVNQVS